MHFPSGRSAKQERGGCAARARLQGALQQLRRRRCCVCIRDKETYDGNFSLNIVELCSLCVYVDVCECMLVCK
jgi:hypothetical protein